MFDDPFARAERDLLRRRAERDRERRRASLVGEADEGGGDRPIGRGRERRRALARDDWGGRARHRPARGHRGVAEWD